MFAGTGAVVVNQVSGGVVTHVGVALTFGLVVMALIYALGDVSGAHLNPARSLGPAVVSGQWSHLWVYLLAPVLGACGAVPVSRLLRAPAAVATV